MGKKYRLENENDNSEEACSRRSEKDSAHAGAGHMGAASGYGRNFKGGNNENECAAHGENNEGLAVVVKSFADREKARHKERNANRSPGNAVAYGKVTLHNVHGVCGKRYAENQRKNACQRKDSFLFFGHFNTPFSN